MFGGKGHAKLGYVVLNCLLLLALFSPSLRSECVGEPPPCMDCACLYGMWHCVADPACTPCTEHADCDDANACTQDICNDVFEFCENPEIPDCCLASTGCDDGNACTSDVCENFSCQHAAVSCDDLEPCTADSCVAPSGCVNDPIDDCCHRDSECTDTDACTDDSCSENSCLNTPILCDDDDPGTVDCCDEGACYHGVAIMLGAEGMIEVAPLLPRFTVGGWLDMNFAFSQEGGSPTRLGGPISVSVVRVNEDGSPGPIEYFGVLDWVPITSSYSFSAPIGPDDLHLLPGFYNVWVGAVGGLPSSFRILVLSSPTT